jgi:ABC-type polysaccharide/polyol phosphate export permease
LTMGMPPLSWAYLSSIIFTLAIFAAGSWFFKKAYKRVLERLTA